jgi:hypothetical protein
MCKITITLYTCNHDIKHIWSHCRGQIKEGPDTDVPACHQKGYNLRVRDSHKCGECTRADAMGQIRRTLGITALTEADQTELDKRFAAEVFRNIPSTNWNVPAPVVYGRKPSQSRSVSRRKGSLLRYEVKAEDVSGPEAWESNIVPDSGDFVPVYAEVSSGWDVEWPVETKSLAEELAEDAAERGMEEHDWDQDQEDQDGEGQDEEDQSEEDDGELRVCEEDDLLLLAQQTPLPLDSEVDEMHDSHYTECDPSSPPTVVDTLMLAEHDFISVNDSNSTPEDTLDTPRLAQHDFISADDANTVSEITLDAASSEPTAQNLPVLESYSQNAESTVGSSNTSTSFTRVTTPYSRSWQLAGDNKVRYWYRQHKSGSPKGKHCWELVSVASI